MSECAKALGNAIKRINDLEAEVFEQARLLGMSGEREAALRAKIARQEKTLKLALEAIEYTLNTDSEWFDVDKAQLLSHRAVDVIREALAERPAQEQESMAWVGLTDEEIKKIWGSYFSRGVDFARAIEAKLKEKNTL